MAGDELVGAPVRRKKRKKEESVERRKEKQENEEESEKRGTHLPGLGIEGRRRGGGRRWL